MDNERKIREIEQRTRRYHRIQRAKEHGLFQSEYERGEIERRVLSKLKMPRSTEENLKENNLLCCDFLLSLFCTSLVSYRRASICDPLPIIFISEKTNEKKFDEVEMCLKSFLDLHFLSTHPQEIPKLPLKSLMLLDWIINPEFDGISVTSISIAEFQQKLAMTRRIPQHQQPNYIFEITYKEFHDSYQRFCSFKQQYGITYGFHGSALENMYSILRNGLDVTYAKEDLLFGTGIYLSTDRDVALNFLKYGQNVVPNSVLGSRLGCLVCCEVVLHPQVKFVKKLTNDVHNSQARSQNDNSGDYIVAPSNDYVLIKYVLVYSDNTSVTQKRRNFCQILLFLYVSVLLLIWFWNSSSS